MPTKSVTIAGLAFDLQAPYEPGHQLTEVEAKVLNQTWSENIRNNQAKAVKDAQEKGTSQDEIAAAVARYATEYTFTTPGTGGTSAKLDPVEREARAIARDALKTQLATKGRKLKDVDPERLATAIDTILANNPDITKLAQKRVRERQKVAEVSLDGLGLEGEAAAA